jgi:phosphatidylserine decarboxylase
LRPEQHNYTNKISRIVGKLARLKSPYFIIKLFVKWYIKHYKIDMNDYDFSLIRGISFNEFFVRKKLNIPEFSNNSVCCPVDGKIINSGSIDEGLIFPVKGQSMKFETLTGDKLLSDQHYSYYNIYLSPADYHRFHAPFNMEIQNIKYLPGKLISVNPKTVKKHENLYCNNERIILKGKWDRGVFWMILVGAFNVGDIEIQFCDIKTNRNNAVAKDIKLQTPILLKAGDEVGRFNFGSTVILCVDSEYNSENKLCNKKIHLGEILCQ